jgi:hypothetical protein
MRNTMIRSLAIGLFAIILLAGIRPAFSIGFGVYGGGGGGRADLLHQDTTVDYTVNQGFYGGGILFESGSHSEEGYHNRLSIGMEGITANGGKYDYKALWRVNLINTFAFRMYATEKIRFWIGPQIGAHVLTGLTATYRNSEWSGSFKEKYWIMTAAAAPSLAPAVWWYEYQQPVWKRTVGLFAHPGLALGLNFQLGETAFFTAECGFRIGLFALSKTGVNYEGFCNAGFIFGSI